MAIPQIHPNWDKPATIITDGYSLEMTAKDQPSLRDAAPLIPAMACSAASATARPSST